MSDINLNSIKTVDTQPFRHLVMTIGELPTSFVDSMTYYEMLAWFVNYLENTIIPTVNNNAECIEELQAAFIELKGYVDTYFDNLDVQEEINNKLDQMAEDGTLQDILMGRDFAINTTLNFNTLFVKSKIVDNISNMNGGCVLPDNSIIQFTGVNGEVYHFSQDGTVLNSNTIEGIGHCNSCTYNTITEKVYVTNTGSAEIGYYKVFEIDPITLELTDTIDCADKDFPAAQLGIIYDKDTDTYIFGNWWGAGSTRYLWKTDNEFNVIDSVELSITNVNSTSNVNLFGNYIGINNMGTHQMFLFNKSDLSYYRTVNINELVSNTWVITEEQWWDTRADGKIVLGFHASASANPHREHATYIYAILDPKANYQEYPFGDKYPPKEEFYRVDHTYTASDRDGSEDRPFNNIYEALNSSLRTTGCTGKVTIRFSNGTANLYNPIFTNNKHYIIWYPSNTIDFFSSIAVDNGVYVHCNRPIELQLLETKTNPFGEGAADIHCYGHLNIEGQLTTPDNVTPILRGFEDAIFEANFDTCGVDVENYYGDITYYGNGNYNVGDLIKHLHFAYNDGKFPNEYHGIKGAITKDANNKYIVPAFSKLIMVLPKLTITTTGSVTTAYESPLIWNPNLWIGDVIVDLDGTKHVLSINTDGTIAVTNNTNVTIDRVRIVSL